MDLAAQYSLFDIKFNNIFVFNMNFFVLSKLTIVMICLGMVFLDHVVAKNHRNPKCKLGRVMISNPVIRIYIYIYIYTDIYTL